MKSRLIATALTLVCCGAFAADSSPTSDELYLQHVKPLLAEKCIVCHGPVKSEAGLRLDAAKLIRAGGKSGAIALAGDPGRSHLIERVTASSIDERMPPSDVGVALNENQVGLLRRWIAEGMVGPEREQVLASPKEHWAFKPIERSRLPILEKSDSSEFIHGQSAIDHFVAAQQRLHRIQPLPMADRATLLRRITLDLTGLPPTAKEIGNFLNDASTDAYSTVVDRLLASPEYGERWGRHWMDVWRYSDWDGYKEELRGSQRHIWHWRDWIIESVNANEPYDRMVREMVAGDELAPTDAGTLRATGFLARSYHRSNRDIWLDATVEHSAKAFFGLTINCARCHDHKYDPISQDDFYRFRAIFEPHNVRTDQLPGEADVMKAGLPRAFDAAPDAQTFLYVRGNEKQPVKDRPIAPGVPAFLPITYRIEPVALPRDGYLPDLSKIALSNQQNAARHAVQSAERDYESARSASPNGSEALQNAEQQVEIAHAGLVSLQARIEADEAKLRDPACKESEEFAKRAAQLERTHKQLESEFGLRKAERNERVSANSTEKDETKRKASVAKAAKELAAARSALDQAIDAFEGDPLKYTPLGTEYPRVSTGRRLALANWITDRKNPLAARVAVNHIWMRHFDRPLVSNPFDFGMKTPEPVTIELLNWLAAEFIDSEWDMKHLHRLIVHSEAYRRASSGSSSLVEQNTRLDPDNRSLWRANVRRLDAEEVRDSMLAVSSSLDSAVGGPDLSEDEGELSPRRSLYFRHAYEKQMTMLVLFDAASPNECYRRSPSIVPQQALVLSNSRLARSASRKLAMELSRGCSSNELEAARAFVEKLFTATLGRMPHASEISGSIAFLKHQAELLSDSSKLDVTTLGSEPMVPAAAEPRLRARQSLAHIMLNHNDFVCVR